MSGSLDLMHLLRSISSEDWANAVNKDLPILLISGDMDPVGNYGAGVKEVYEWMEKAGLDVELKLYAGARHELLNEIGRNEIFDDLFAWIQKRI